MSVLKSLLKSLRNKLVIVLSFAFGCSIAAAAVAQERHAILVGVETYNPVFFENLDYAEDDAIELGKALKGVGYETAVMTSKAESSQLKPTTPDKILALLKARLSTLGNEDTLVFSLSGHGVQFTDDPLLESGIRETYFCPEDADLTDKSTLLPISQVVKLISDSAAARKLLIIDACREEIASEKGKRKSGAKKIELGSIHENKRSIPGGMSVFFSCESQQFSWEHKELGHSVFTKYIIDYFRGTAGEGDYEDGLNLDGLVFYVRKATNNYVLKQGFTTEGQTPVIRGGGANWKLGSIEKLDSYSNVELETVKLHARFSIPEAVINMGWRHYEGKGVAQDFSEAMKWFKKAADQDDANAQNWVGYLYQHGIGVSLDYSEAMKWYKKAADQNYAAAQDNVGHLYLHGKGVSLDYSEAMKWHKKAADQNYAVAQNNIGHLYQHGKGVSLDYTEAMKWYKKAADQNEAAAQYNIGHLYHHGKGVSQDYSEAMMWYRKAADQNYASAQVNIGALYNNGNGVTQDYNEAMKWFQKAADQNDADAQNWIGSMHYFGRGVSLDYSEALKWYRNAADQNQASAQFSLGFMYKYGEGVSKNTTEARKWLQKALDNGHADAKQSLETLDR